MEHLPNGIEINFDIVHEAQTDHVAFGNEHKLFVAEHPLIDLLFKRVNDPVLAHTGSLVEIFLDGSNSRADCQLYSIGSRPAAHINQPIKAATGLVDQKDVVDLYKALASVIDDANSHEFTLGGG